MFINIINRKVLIHNKIQYSQTLIFYFKDFGNANKDVGSTKIPDPNIVLNNIYRITEISLRILYSSKNNNPEK